MSTAVLELRDLSVDIPVPAGTVHALRDVSFELERKETFCLVGESGCGKTMTALAIMGLLPPRARRRATRLSFDGRDLGALDERALAELRGAEIAMVFQDATSALNPVFTIGSQLEQVYLRHRKAGRAEARERARYLLERLGITAPALRLKQYPHELSGGLRQRVMIAMALMCEPSVLIADEPTTALDVTVQARILALLAELQQELALALLLIAHDLGVVASIADRVAIMYAGSIVESGTVQQVFRAPTHPYTQKLMACVPRRGRALASIPGMVPTLTGDLEGCMFRNRCERVHGACEHGDIELREARAGHRYRCLLDLQALRGPAARAGS